MKRILKITAIALAIVVVVLVAIPFFMDVNSFRPKLEAIASEAMGRQVKVGNLSLIGGNVTKKAPAQNGQSTPTDLSVAKLSVNDGKLIVGKANSKAKSHVYDQVNITVTDFSPTSQFPFTLAAKLPAGGSADISGKAGPINAADATKTSFSSTVKVNRMDIGASGFIDPASGIAGLASLMAR